jgi:acyl-CoA hydrolase
MVFVALDAPNGRPTPVPAWTPQTEEARQLQIYARKLAEMTREMEREVAAHRPPATTDA